MLTKYDPERAPDPERWLAADEQWKFELVRRYHRRMGIHVEREMLHASMHTAVENQVAMGKETPVAAAVERLMGEGLSRHDAVHAVAAVLAWHMAGILSGRVPEEPDPNEVYFAEVRVLTKQKWYDEFGPDPEEEP
jgi:hypothetical protein